MILQQIQLLLDDELLLFQLRYREKIGINISRQTVIRRLDQNHFKYRKFFKVPELTNFLILLRYTFAFLFYQNDFDFKNDTIVFSDEARFFFRPDNCKWQDKDGDLPENETTCIRKYPFSTLIWAAIRRNYKSQLIFFDKSVNEQRYKRLLIDLKNLVNVKKRNQLIFYFNRM